MSGTNPMVGVDPGHAFSDVFLLKVDVVRDLKVACMVWLAELAEIRRDALILQEVKGMGTLKSGQDLARKFSLKAAGGDDSLEKSLDSHITVVTEMRDFFQKCVDRYESVDASNATTLTTAETPK